MGKVNWNEALALYVTQHNESYGKLAKRYKVAKSTIVRHAVRHNWPYLREQYNKKRVKRLTGSIFQARVEADERHLKLARLIQAVANTEATRLAVKIQEGFPLTRAEARSMNDLIGATQRGIKLERIILGLPTKPIRMTDPQAFAEIRGPDPHLGDSPGEFYVNAKKSIKKLDAHRELLQKYIDQVEKTGSYSV